MTKEAEIAALRKFFKELPGAAYTKAWLQNQLPQIESLIQSDIYPGVTMCLTAAEFRQLRLDEIAATKVTCAELLKEAGATAEKITDKASKVMEDASAAIHRAQHALEW